MGLDGNNHQQSQKAEGKKEFDEWGRKKRHRNSGGGGAWPGPLVEQGSKRDMVDGLERMENLLRKR